jgi:hypothetical protein
MVTCVYSLWGRDRAEYAVQAIPQPAEDICLLRLIPLLALVNRPNQLTWLVPDEIRAKFQGYPIGRSRVWTFRVSFEFGETWYDAFAEQGAIPLGSYPPQASALAYSNLQVHLGSRAPVPLGYVRSLIEAPGRLQMPPDPLHGAPAAVFTFPIPPPEQAPEFRARNRALLLGLGFKFAASLPTREPQAMVVRPRWEIVCRFTAMNILCHFVCGGGLDAREDAKKAQLIAAQANQALGLPVPPVDPDSDDESGNTAVHGNKVTSKAARLQSAREEESSPPRTCRPAGNIDAIYAR